jgi:SAM-dependent methyltransferase
MKIILDDLSFYFSGNGEKKDKLLLSLNDYSENLSKLPLANKLNYETESVLSILNKVVEGYGKLSKIPNNPQSLACILEVICKLIKMCIQKQRPYNILELGAKQGLLTYFLTYIAREFNEKNMVHAVSGYLFNQHWFSFLQEYGNALGNLNLHATESQTLSLQENYFDFCVMNCSEDFPNSDAVLNNAIRLLNHGGVLVFISADEKIIEQKISLERKQTAYRESSEANIDLQKEEMEILLLQVEKRLIDMEKLTKEELYDLIKDITYLEKLVIKLFAYTEDIDLKYKLSITKEKALNFLYFLS